MKLTPIGSNKTQVTFDLWNGPMDILFSYQTPVAARLPSGRFLRTSQKFSITTSKHINQWLRANNAEDIEAVPQSRIEELVK